MMLNNLFSSTWLALLLTCIGLVQSEVVWVVRVCFSNETFVETVSASNGFQSKFTRINKLKEGDLIKTFDQATNSFIFSRFIDYMHYDQSALVEYLTLNTVDSDSDSYQRSLISFKPLEITGYHLIKRLKRTVKPNSVDSKKLDLHVDDFEFVFAKDVQVGDHVIVEDLPGLTSMTMKRVVSIGKETRYGAYAPLTEHGTLLVNGVHVSCYGNLNSHEIADYVFVPLKLWTKYISDIATCSSTTLRADFSRPIVYMNSFTRFLYSIAVNIPLGSALVL